MVLGGVDPVTSGPNVDLKGVITGSTAYDALTYTAKHPVLPNSTITLKWTLGTDAKTCSATGGWIENSKILTQREATFNVGSGSKTLTLTCKNAAGVSSTDRLVIDAITYGGATGDGGNGAEAPENGACGSTAGTCTAGTPDTSNSTSQASWVCKGKNGGSDKPCSTNNQTTPIVNFKVFDRESAYVDGPITLPAGITSAKIRYSGTEGAVCAPSWKFLPITLAATDKTEEINGITASKTFTLTCGSVSKSVTVNVSLAHHLWAVHSRQTKRLLRLGRR